MRLLARAAVEAEAHRVERGLVGAPVARQRRRDRAAVRGRPPRRATSRSETVASPHGKAKELVAGDQKEARWRTSAASRLNL